MNVFTHKCAMRVEYTNIHSSVQYITATTPFTYLVCCCCCWCLEWWCLRWWWWWWWCVFDLCDLWCFPSLGSFVSAPPTADTFPLSDRLLVRSNKLVVFSARLLDLCLWWWWCPLDAAALSPCALIPVGSMSVLAVAVVVGLVLLEASLMIAAARLPLFSSPSPADRNLFTGFTTTHSSQWNHSTSSVFCLGLFLGMTNHEQIPVKDD